MEPRDIVADSRDLPFPIMLTETMEIKEFSFRRQNSMRPTARYFVNSSGKIFRIKEFFMDWFYTGFPKSLMKSLVDTYGRVEPHVYGDIIYYYGRNYKGNDSVSFHHGGTTVEIECLQGAEAPEFIPIIADLHFPPGILERYLNRGFAERSFLANAHSGNWWEDKRIARMHWADIQPRTVSWLRNSGMSARSVGTFTGSDGTRLRTVIHSDPSFSRVIWVDMLDEGSNIPHGKYDFRTGGSLFTLEEDGLFFLEPYGPAAYLDDVEGYTMTIAFSPGLDINFVRNIVSSVREVASNSAEVTQSL